MRNAVFIRIQSTVSLGRNSSRTLKIQPNYESERWQRWTKKTKRKCFWCREPILQDVDAFASRRQLKDADGDFDFSSALQMRYKELLQRERDFETVKPDLNTWKGYTQTQQEKTTKTCWCERLKMEVLSGECQICAEKRLNPACPKTKTARRWLTEETHSNRTHEKKN